MSQYLTNNTKSIFAKKPFLKHQSMHKVILFAIIFLLNQSILSSCQSVPSCEEDAKYFSLKTVNMKVLDLGSNSRNVKLSGVNIDAQKPQDFYEMSGLFLIIRRHIETGDTLKKEIGTYNFLIKKKCFDVKIDFKCQNKMPTNLQIDTIFK